MDKRIPHIQFMMKRSAALPPIFPPALPAGYAYRLYQPGDAANWSRIECLAGEFDHENDARKYFEKEFLPHEAELKRRMVFVTDDSGRAIATATAWLSREGEALIPRLHWVAAIPEKQGLGLGRAVTMKALSLFPDVGPPGDIVLSTQTWSHRAVGLYLCLGFRVQRDGAGFEHACEVLRGVMQGDAYRMFCEVSADGQGYDESKKE